MAELFNKIFSIDFTKVSAQEKVNMFADLLNEIFAFVLGKLGA
jgi:hypothetical protein